MPEIINDKDYISDNPEQGFSRRTLLKYIGVAALVLTPLGVLEYFACKSQEPIVRAEEAAKARSEKLAEEARNLTVEQLLDNLQRYEGVDVGVRGFLVRNSGTNTPTEISEILFMPYIVGGRSDYDFTLYGSDKRSAEKNIELKSAMGLDLVATDDQMTQGVNNALVYGNLTKDDNGYYVYVSAIDFSDSGLK